MRLRARRTHSNGSNVRKNISNNPFRELSLSIFLAISIAALPSLAAAAPAPGDLAELSIEQLSQIQITSVSKQQESLLDAAASVYVITNKDIRMSGVTSIPEALRLAPGVEVARNGSHEWAISIRGFNSDIANKLLVLIDGRSVYSPLFAGVFWDAQDVLLEDVDRIEVVSGPGGTLYGANAVNGVINIITRSAKETEGGFLEIGGGNEEDAFIGLRYGTELGNGASLRSYIKSFDRDNAVDANGVAVNDNWQMTQGGFRLDWLASESDRFTLQGDIYRGRESGLFRDSFTLGTLPGPSFNSHSDLAGGNVLGRWTRQLDQDSDFSLQAYYDHTERDIPNTYNESRDTFDIDFQHHFNLFERHDILWGVGYRLTRDKIDNSLFASFMPDRRTDRTYSAFIQDKIDLQDDKLFLTLGSKFEQNDYSGFEIQPNARLTWLISERQTLWAAASRAARIPSRLDADLVLTAPVSIPGLPFPIYINVIGNDEFESEELWAYEAGYRIQARDNLSFDLSVFYNEYDNLQTTEPETPIVVINPPVIYIVLPNSLANGMRGQSHGGTLAIKWNPISNWRLQFNYAYFDMQLRNKPGSQDTSALRIVGNSPKNQFSLFSFLDLPQNVSLFTGLRHVDELPNQNVDSYTALDVGIDWTPHKNLSFSLVGRNITDSSHAEFSAPGVEAERSIHGRLTYRF